MAAMGQFQAQVAEGQRRLKARREKAPALVANAFKRGQTSDALAVHPDQVKEATDHAKKCGVPTQYRPDGKPIIVSCAHQKALAKLSGFRPKRGY